MVSRIGFALLVVWLAYLSLQLRHVGIIAVDACAVAFAAYQQRGSSERLRWNSSDCPDWINSSFFGKGLDSDVPGGRP